jgi:hypothetical protein
VAVIRVEAVDFINQLGFGQVELPELLLTGGNLLLKRSRISSL